MSKLALHWQILIALVLAFISGAFTAPDSVVFGIKFYAVYDFIGTFFLNALKMIIVPLVLASIITGVAGIGSADGLGRLGFKTILFYVVSSFFAIVIGLFFVNLFQPGIIDGVPAKDLLGLTSDRVADVASRVGGKDASSISDVFLGLVPPNIIKAAANGQMLGLIFFAILFGVYITKITKKYADAQYNFWQGLFEVMMKMTNFIISFAPIGVFGLVAKVIADIDADELDALFESLFWFTFSVMAALATHTFIVLPLLLKFIAKVKPTRHIKAMAPAMLTAFSTASSSATLPLTIKCIENNAGVSNRTSSFVLPLGATVNMDGTALYECVAAMFIAQAYGLDLTVTVQFTVVLVALLTSIGVAGIPSASLVAITIILSAIGLPLDGVALIFIVDRILDMFRTSVNIFSDSCCAVIVARLEGEEGILGESKALTVK